MDNNFIGSSLGEIDVDDHHFFQVVIEIAIISWGRNHILLTTVVTMGSPRMLLWCASLGHFSRGIHFCCKSTFHPNIELKMKSFDTQIYQLRHARLE
jgi:hypothetical protein